MEFFSQKLKSELPYDPANIISGYLSEEKMKTQRGYRIPC